MKRYSFVFSVLAVPACSSPVVDVVVIEASADPQVYISPYPYSDGWTDACSFAFWPEPPIEGVDSQPNMLVDTEAILQLDYGSAMSALTSGNSPVLTSRFGADHKMITALYDPSLSLYDVDANGERRLPDGSPVVGRFELQYEAYDENVESTVIVTEIHAVPVIVADVPVHEREFFCL